VTVLADVAERRVGDRVVARDVAPSRRVAGVGIRSVQEVAVEHEGVARLHLDVEELEPCEGGFEVFFIDDRLAVDSDVVEPAERVRSRQHLSIRSPGATPMLRRGEAPSSSSCGCRRRRRCR